VPKLKPPPKNPKKACDCTGTSKRRVPRSAAASTERFFMLSLL
jgi:hypothetical protein